MSVANSFPSSLRRGLAALALLVLSSPGFAQLNDPRLPISLDADYSDYDGKSSMLTFRGLRLSQGRISVEAEQGRASELNFEESVWQLSGSVAITVNNGEIRCETADLEFRDNQLKVASISGAPATFELRRPGSEEPTFAEARLLRYDLDAGTIEFSGDAKIVEGGNQISSGFLVYNIAEQRIQAQGSDEDDGKVKITFTPRDEEQDDDGDGSQ